MIDKELQKQIMAENKERFIEARSQAFYGVLIDSQTGVEYLQTTVGLTLLVNADGSPKVNAHFKK